MLVFSITDGHKTTITATTAADSSNCNIESLHNPLNSGLLSSHHKEGKYDRSTRAIIKHHPDKSIDFSPLSSPESPEDNNEGPLSLLSATANIKCGASVEDEEEGDDDHEQGLVVLQETEAYSNDNLHYNDSEVDGDRRGRAEKVELLEGVGGRSSGRKLQQHQQQQQHHQQIMLNHEHSPQQHRRQVRRHRRNNSKNGMKNRDNNFISQVTSSLPPQMIASFSAGGKALENQVSFISS